MAILGKIKSHYLFDKNITVENIFKEEDSFSILDINSFKSYLKNEKNFEVKIDLNLPEKTETFLNIEIDFYLLMPKRKNIYSLMI